jgi:hypothetical protein
MPFVLRVNRIWFVGIVHARAVSRNNPDDDLILAPKCRPSPSSQPRGVLTRVVDAVRKISIGNVGDAAEIPSAFREGVLIPSHRGMMLWSMGKPVVPLGLGAELFKVQVHFNDTEKVQLILFYTLVYLLVFVMFGVYWEAANITERYSRVICRAGIQWIPPVVRHLGGFVTVLPYTLLTSHTLPWGRGRQLNTKCSYHCYRR